jgi:lysophospholipase L1-like esterase
MGDSITEGWALTEFFSGKPYLNRGISGQTTPQMLVRFRQDVVSLKPRVVVLLAGINDIAENTGKTTLEAIEGNIASMSEIAQANGIRVVLCSVLPASKFAWRPEILEPATKVRALNAWIQRYSGDHALVYVDYYSSMVDDNGGLKPELGSDGVHPNRVGYDVMAPLAAAGIEKATR